MREIASTARSKAAHGLEPAHRPPGGALGRADRVRGRRPAHAGRRRHGPYARRRRPGRERAPGHPARRPPARRPGALPRDRGAVARLPAAQRRGVAASCSAPRVATTVGAVDDFRGLRWWEKLSGQVGAAAIPVGFGVWVHAFTFPIIGVRELPAAVGVPLTIAGIVALMNVVNFLDGLDGLAAGVCAISALSFCVIDLSLGRADAVLAQGDREGPAGPLDRAGPDRQDREELQGRDPDHPRGSQQEDPRPPRRQDLQRGDERPRRRGDRQEGRQVHRRRASPASRPSS